jgi:glyoxylase-like metal-dependent hydrolase (beta-lactamase superfamily II)
MGLVPSTSDAIDVKLEASDRYSWSLLRGGPIRLDGGGMFGVVPRVLWSRMFPPDELNRITLAHNCLLLERIGATAGPRRVVIEVGSGDKFGPKMRKIYGLEDRTIIDALAEAGTRCEDIDHVIVSHLHFDHAGGLTRRTRPGEKPDWIRPAHENNSPDEVSLTFPSARITVQRREWEDAIVNRSVMSRTYLPDHLLPVRERLNLVDSPAPLTPGRVPSREEMPTQAIRDRETEVIPGIYVSLVPGHTWGQQIIRFIDDRGRVVVFTPDVLPTIHHANPAYSLAYDVEPYTTSVTKRWFLNDAVENDWLLVLDHEPANPLQRVRRDGKGWYELVEEV